MLDLRRQREVAFGLYLAITDNQMYALFRSLQSARARVVSWCAAQITRLPSSYHKARLLFLRYTNFDFHSVGKIRAIINICKAMNLASTNKHAECLMGRVKLFLLRKCIIVAGLYPLFMSILINIRRFQCIGRFLGQSYSQSWTEMVGTTRPDTYIATLAPSCNIRSSREM